MTPPSARSTPPSPRAVLGPNRYGKAECRIVRVTREEAAAGVPARHHVKDLNVSVSLTGAMDAVHHRGDNAAVLPTDTAKNTVYAFAKEYGIASAEGFGILLARHFVTGQETIRGARIRIGEYGWRRIGNVDLDRDPGVATGTGRPSSGAVPGTGHSFVRSGQETRTAEVVFDGEGFRIVSGLRGLVVLNTTGSEFRGFARDRYTTLEEADDRVLATEVGARWRHRWTGRDGGWPEPDWDGVFVRARARLLEAFAGTYSRSLQQTLYRMGADVVEEVVEIDEIRLSLPNRHHFLVDLERFGLRNDNEVYYAADRPYGLIEGTVLREGAEALIPED